MNKSKTRIVDAYGREVRSQVASNSNRFLTSASVDGRGQVPRPYWIRDTAQMMPDCDRRIMVGLSNWLYWNTYIGGIIDDRATDAIGDAWDLQYLGTSKKWGAQAEEWFYQHGKICDVGGRLQWRDFLKLGVIEHHRDGDAFRLLTETDAAYPQQQAIPSTRVNDSNGKTKGGIETTSQGRPVSYSVDVDNANGIGTTSEPIPANDMHHIVNWKHVDQYRGLPSVTRGGRTLQDQQDSEEFQRISFKMACAIGLLRRTGASDDSMNLLEAEDGKTIETLPLFELAAGSMPVLPTGYDMESFQNNHPGERFIEFVNYLARIILLGMGIPYEYAFNPETLTGPAMRFIMLKAAKGIAEDQVLIERYAFRYYAFAIAKAFKLGLIPKPPVDWWNVTFSKPRQPSIDLGRDASADSRDFLLGNKTRRQHLMDRQQDPDAFRREKLIEVRGVFEDAAAIATEFKVPIETALKYIENRDIVLAPEQPQPQEPAKK